MRQRDKERLKQIKRYQDTENIREQVLIRAHQIIGDGSNERESIDSDLFTRMHSIANDAIISEEDRHIRLTFSSEEPYKRGWWDPWIEILGHNPDEVDLSRLENGAPVLQNHWGGIGVVESGWVDAERGTAQVRLSKREEVDGLWQDIKDGIVRNVSVGYRVHERVLIRESDDSPDEYRVTRWEPLEISILSDVPPADASVGIGRAFEPDQAFFQRHALPRNDAPPADASRAVNSLPTGQAEMDAAIAAAVVAKLDEKSNPNEETQMEDDDNVIELDTKEIEEKAAREALKKDQARRTDIDNVFALYPNQFTEQRATFANQRRDDGEFNSVEDAKNLILKALAEKNKDVEPLGRDASIEITHDEADKFQRSAENSLLARAQVEEDDPNNELRGVSLVRLAEHCLTRSGRSVAGMSQTQIVEAAFLMSRDGGAHTPGDFPLILANSANKSMLMGYTETPETFQAWTLTGNLSDFKLASRVGLSEMESLDEVKDTGEVQYGSAAEVQETIQLKQYAKRFKLSRAAIINDDLGAFTTIPRKMGRAAMRTVGDTAYGVLTANAAMSDTVAIFHATHKNLETGAGSAFSTANLSKMRQKMAKQQDYANKATLNIMPSIWLGPVALEDEARITFASESDPTATNNNSRRPNVVRGLVQQIIADARLDVASATAYYLLGSPNAYDTVEVAYLDGNPNPRLMQQSIWLTDGVTFEVAHDFAAAARDFRAMQKADGA